MTLFGYMVSPLDIEFALYALSGVVGGVGGILYERERLRIGGAA